ncbi:MAG: cell division protein [Caulobacteraceae bacterium]|nr:cell division protein [Caulobacteraceae bacterium]
MSVFGVLNRRVRGFRVIELGAASILAVLVLGVYTAKTGAGDKRDDIAHTEQQIDEEQARIRLLRAEVASEERPERLQALAARYLNLEPITPRHEIDADALADVAHMGAVTHPAAASAAATSSPTSLSLTPAATVPVTASVGSDH